MQHFLILSLVAVTASSFAAENEPPKLQPLPKPALLAMAPPTVSPEQTAIAKTAGEYIAAFNAGDYKALAAFYEENADQMDGDGNVVLSGRASIAKRLQDYFLENKGAQLELRVHSVRLLAPGAALESGQAIVTLSNGNTAASNYLAIHVKHEGKWLIAHLTETVGQPEPSPYTHLQELEWMVGSWRDNTSDAEVRTTCKWATNKTFLTRSFRASSKDRGELQGTEVMGWDPLKGNIHAWTFDSEGGFTDAIWTRDGHRWLIQSVTTLPDGRRASAHNTITRLSDDKYTWESTNRVVDGELRPSIDKFEIDRVKSQD